MLHKSSWKKIVLVAACLGLGLGSASALPAAEGEGEAGFPNQCYFSNCKGCGNSCGGGTSICCCQSGNCDSETTLE
jgi:hypothetical protein